MATLVLFGIISIVIKGGIPCTREKRWNAYNENENNAHFDESPVL
jgi:hypothetical protein